MKAVAIKDVKQFEIKEIPEPNPDGKKVIIEVSKTGICGSDIHYWVNGEPKGLVMGHEFSGVVLDPGDRLDLIKGDRVTALPISPCGKCEACLKGEVQYCPHTWSDALGLALTNPGALGEKISVRSDMVYKVPDNVSDVEMAMVEPTAVALHAIHLADIKVGAKVLVVGGGIIGLLSAMLAKKEGASFVALSETNPNRGKKALTLASCDKYYDATNKDMLTEINTDTQGGFDVVIECCGNAPAVSSAIMAVKPGGLVVLVGVATEAIPTPTVVAVMKEVKLQGAIAYTKEEFKTCIDLIASGQIEVKQFVDDIVGYNEVQKAYERLTSGTDSAVKILVDPSK